MGAWSAGIPGMGELFDKNLMGLLSGSASIDEATKGMVDSANKATGSISDATNKAMAFNAPYMNPEVFKRLSDLVTSGAFQTPYSGSYQPPAWQTPNMTMNPSWGNLAMHSGFQGQPPPMYGSQGLPPGMAQMVQRPQPPPQLPPPAQGGPQLNPNPGINMAAILAHNIQASQHLPRIPPPNLPGNPVSVLNPFQFKNPMTDPISINSFPRPGSGPFMPGGFNPTNPRPGIPGGPSLPPFIPNNPTAGQGPGWTGMLPMSMFLNGRVA